jgi:hypothetical protein
MLKGKIIKKIQNEINCNKKIMTKCDTKIKWRTFLYFGKPTRFRDDEKKMKKERKKKKAC